MNALQDPLKNGAITLPGAHQLTLTGIVFAGEPTTEEFIQIIRIAQTIDRVQSWVVGDVLKEYVRREQHSRPGMTVGTLINEYAMAHGMQIEVARSRYDVAKHYKHSDRTQLSWTHHWFLWSSGIPIWECKKWLSLCLQNAWNVARLRAEFKIKMRPAVVEEPILPGICPDWLRDAIDHASGCLSEVDTMPIDQVGALLHEAEPLATYIDALRARVATPTKESIRPAA